jgi:hypothetical protein
MGALTSWAFGLALVHHWIVQSAAERAFGRIRHPFSRYALLGDDIVIWDDRVALHYQDILKELGVGIGIHKSLISDSCLEFAKRFMVKGVDCSPSSFSEWWMSTHHLGAALEFYQHFCSILNTQFKWKRALGLTRIGATKWNRLSTSLSILWNLSHSPSLWSFYSTRPNGTTRIVPSLRWRGLVTSYRDRAFRAIDKAHQELWDRWTVELDDWEESVLRLAFGQHQDWSEQIYQLSELKGSFDSSIDPGNLELFRESLKDSRVFSHFFDEAKLDDKIRSWTLRSYYRLNRGEF